MEVMRRLSTTSKGLLATVLCTLLAHAEERLKVHGAPGKLHPAAQTSDWPRMLGPAGDATSPETHLIKEWGPDGPRQVWEIAKGDGYTTPSIVGDACVLFHAVDGQEKVECIHAETGVARWSYGYPISYQDRLGYANGPRGSATISQGRVLTLGVTSRLHCLDLQTGKLLWELDLAEKYAVPQEFFGHGSTPLVEGDKVFINVGGKGEKITELEDKDERTRKLATPGACVAAFDLATGKELWTVKDEWGSSYASPLIAQLHGQPRLLVFAGGESDPATGGLLCINPESGKVYARHFWRADMYTSVNATTPVVIPGKNRVLITTAYPKGRPIGALMLEFDAQWQAREVWKSEKLACHWMQPLYIDGHLYAIDGETERQAELVCVEAETGREVWRKDHQWDLPMEGKSYRVGLMRASLLHVDGAVLCLGETGSLHWLELTPAGMKELARAQLWLAPHTWSLPVVSRGLLYVAQHDRGRDGTEQRYVCYDLRKSAQE
jgi:outer membrane protein assembly factor BamB